MKIIDKVDDSFDSGERIYYIVELEENVYVDVMHIVNEECFYIMELSFGGYAYDCESNKLDYPINEDKLIDFVKEYIG